MAVIPVHRATATHADHRPARGARTIWTFNEFDDIFLLTGGAAGTNVASVQIYNFLTVQRNVGAAAAQSVIMALVLVAMLAVYLTILRRRGERV